MKRGIPIALQAAGAVLACLVTILNHPVMAFEHTVSMRDTAYYFNELGQQIYCDTKAAKRGSYVIRTCKTYQVLYADWIERNTKQSSGVYRTAKVNNITPKKAAEVGALIRKGKIKDSTVINNIVAILDKMTLKKILFKIIDSTVYDTGGEFIEYGGDGMFREFGGEIWTNLTFAFISGRPTDPRKSYNKGVNVGVGPLGHFHSHPGGEILKPIGNGKDSVFKFVQAPSYQDTRSIGKKTGYVFALHKDILKLFVYDRFGVKACLPLDYLKITTPCR
jgi:hypothetical protein